MRGPEYRTYEATELPVYTVYTKGILYIHTYIYDFVLMYTVATEQPQAKVAVRTHTVLRSTHNNFCVCYVVVLSQ